MSGAGLIELLAARLGGRGARRAAPALREALAEVSARGANQSDPLVTVYRGGGDGQFWTPNAETAAGYGPVRRGMLDTNGFGSAEYTAEMANQSDDFGAFIQNQMARAESENLPGVTLDGIPDLPNWDIQRQYIVRDPSRLRDIAEHGPAAEAAPSLRDALSKINASRIGPDARPVQAGRDAGFDESATWYRGGRPGSGRTFLTRDRALAERFARDLHGTDEVAAGNVASGRQMVVDWSGRPWDAGPSGWSTDHMAEVARREGYDSVLLQNVESVRGSPADELVLLNENQFRTAPDGGSAQNGFSVPRRSELDRMVAQARRDHPNNHPEDIGAIRWVRDAEGNYHVAHALDDDHFAMLERLKRQGIEIPEQSRENRHLRGHFFRDENGQWRSTDMNGQDGPLPTRNAPNAGSDRNALQRALRDRMNRE